jgi:hypothetical protein
VLVGADEEKIVEIIDMEVILSSSGMMWAEDRRWG